MTSDADYSPKYDDWSDGYPPDWNSRKKRVKLRDDYTCQECGDKFLPENDVRLDVHHIVPKSEGGPHTFDNLQTLCRQCHAAKHPNNVKLARRADTSPNPIAVLLGTFFVWLIDLVFDVPDEETEELSLEVRTISNISTAHDRVHITAKVVQLWDPNDDDMQQVGLLTDGDDRIKFTSWDSDEVKHLQEGDKYRLEYASVKKYAGKYDGNVRLKLDTYTEIEQLVSS